MRTSQEGRGSSDVGTCPYCRFPIKSSSETATCENCGSAYHAECWTETDWCTKCGHAPAHGASSDGTEPYASHSACASPVTLHAVHEATEVFADLGGGTAGFATAYHLLRGRLKRKRKQRATHTDQEPSDSSETLGEDTPPT
jgi:hypothetical protein